MRSGNWDWERSGPLRVAEVNGQLVSLDNRRLLAAQLSSNVESVPIERISLSDPLPPPATGGTFGSSVPRVQLPPEGTPNKPLIVGKDGKIKPYP